jgi:hypothetical protein
MGALVLFTFFEMALLLYEDLARFNQTIFE